MENISVIEGRKQMFLFNDALNTFYLRLYGDRHMVKDHSDSEKGNPLPPHTVGYSLRLTARVLLYTPSYRQDSTYHGLCYTGRGALAGTRNSSMGSPHEGSIRRPIAPWANALTTELVIEVYQYIIMLCYITCCLLFRSNHHHHNYHQHRHHHHLKAINIYHILFYILYFVTCVIPQI